MNFFSNLDPANQVLLILAIIAFAFDRITAICDSTARRRRKDTGMRARPRSNQRLSTDHPRTAS